MSRVRSIATNPRRLAPLVLALALVGLVAAGLLVDPPSSTRSGAADRGTNSKVDGRTTSDGDDIDATTTEPGVGSLLADPAAPRSTEASKVEGMAADAEADTDASRNAVAPSAGDAGGGASVLEDSVAPTSAPADLPLIDQRIVRNGTIDLRVKRGAFEDTWGDAQAVAGALGGYIVTASRSGTGTGPRVGSITMRVPTAKFDTAVDRLRDLDGVKVRRLDITSEDVTQEFVDVRSRLKHDRAVEARLLALLAQTKGVSEVLAVQTRLDQVQEQIELSKGRLDYLDKMTSSSTVQLAISEPGATTPDKADENDEPSVLGAAWDDARERFTGNVASAVVWSGGALPTLLLLGAIALAIRVVWRRKTRATDAAE